MTVTPQADEIRLLVARTFEEFGTPIANILDLNETLLIKHGQYVARSYRANGLMAMWLLQAGIIQFYDRNGVMLRTVNLFLELEPQTIAA
jgi:hypothetical protein